MWPVVVIDFEASSLEFEGYPIEVGIAIGHDAGRPMSLWSSLITPTEEWRRHGHWSVQSQKIHGIRGSDLLRFGQPPQIIAETLNSLLAGIGIAWCDGGPYDHRWLAQIFAASTVTPAFALGDYQRLIKEDQLPANMPHRAGQDAAILLSRLMVERRHG